MVHSLMIKLLHFQVFILLSSLLAGITPSWQIIINDNNNDNDIDDDDDDDDQK